MGLAERYFGDLPTCINYLPPMRDGSLPGYWTLPGVGGGVLVGAFHGSVAFMEEMPGIEDGTWGPA